ncbi:MAG: TPM domain-containing protein [Chitinophagales bacterium]|nr:TPM domain-containing protein [Chitinophagales bacterium]
MSDVKNFFKDSSLIVETIGEVEKVTSGEIKIHLETRCKGDLAQRVQSVFHQLKMDKLPQKNGVLIYISIQDKKLSILGDQNIHRKVGDDFWQGTIANLSIDFKAFEFDKGIIRAIKDVGDKLSKHFPFDVNNVVNDLPDDISYGD